VVAVAASAQQPTAYTPAIMKPVTMYAARTMCGTSYGVALLKITAHGFTWVIRPWAIVNPDGWFIHEFAATTENAPSTPEITRGTPVHQCNQAGSRRQAYR
jgi:hypothetical protein